jgi:hypothetical protein
MIDMYALDRESFRRYTPDGALHLDTTNISKAIVNEYWGREIPGCAEMGLDKDRMYRLYRDPEELKKAAPTFNNLPVLREHTPVTADSYPQSLIIGTTGSGAAFDGTYLKNSMAIWPGDDIKKIETNVKKQLSSGYRYRADMTPGKTPDGQAYDGVMRDIVGNHVAVVLEGRAGPDVVVCDEASAAFRSMFMMDQKFSQMFAHDTAQCSYANLFSKDEQERDADGKFGSGSGSHANPKRHAGTAMGGKKEYNGGSITPSGNKFKATAKNGISSFFGTEEEAKAHIDKK